MGVKRRTNCLLAGVFIILAFTLLLSPVPGGATPIIIDFGTGNAGNGGLITLLGSSNAKGVDIPVDVLTYTNVPITPAGGTIYDLSGTGVSNDADGSAVLAFDTTTNFITITGGVPLLNIPNGTILLSGTFSSFQIFGPLGNFLGVYGNGPDTKNQDLLAALQVDPNSQFQFFGFSMTGLFNPLTKTGVATSTDVGNTAVPEPATMLLLGTGLVGIGMFARRKFRRT